PTPVRCALSLHDALPIFWALPFLTVLAPSERYHQTRGQRHKSVTDWARQMILRVRRWLPDRSLVVVADQTYAVLVLLARAVRAQDRKSTRLNSSHRTISY